MEGGILRVGLVVAPSQKKVKETEKKWEKTYFEAQTTCQHVVWTYLGIDVVDEWRKTAFRGWWWHMEKKR